MHWRRLQLLLILRCKSGRMHSAERRKRPKKPKKSVSQSSQLQRLWPDWSSALVPPCSSLHEYRFCIPLAGPQPAENARGQSRAATGRGKKGPEVLRGPEPRWPSGAFISRYSDRYTREGVDLGEKITWLLTSHSILSLRQQINSQRRRRLICVCVCAHILLLLRERGSEERR